MAEEAKDHSSIGPLNATAQKEGLNLTGLILLDMVAFVVALYIIGAIANALL
jgi:hypothetical protein